MYAYPKEYDVVIVGAGHAGCEAALAAAKMGLDTLLLTIFAAQALLLAVIGIYGVMSYSVAQRTRETGIRMAIGATRAATLRMILWQGTRLALLGVVLGALGAAGLTHLMRTLLFDVTATDPTTFAMATVALVLAAVGASIVPALRATRIDPMVALREE